LLSRPDDAIQEAIGQLLEPEKILDRLIASVRGHQQAMVGSMAGAGGGSPDSAAPRPATRPDVKRLQGPPQVCAQAGQAIQAACVLSHQARLAELPKSLVQDAGGHVIAAVLELERPHRLALQLPQDPQRPSAAQQIHGCHHGTAGPRPADPPAGRRCRSHC